MLTEKISHLQKVQKEQLLTLDLTIDKLEKIKSLILELNSLGFNPAMLNFK